MSKKSSKSPLQIRVPTTDKPGAELAAKLGTISEKSGLSLNDVCNLCLAAGLPMVEKNLGALRNPEPELPKAA